MTADAYNAQAWKQQDEAIRAILGLGPEPSMLDVREAVQRLREDKERLEDLLTKEPTLEMLHAEAGRVEARLGPHAGARLLAASLGKSLKDANAANYVQVEVHHPEFGPLVVVIQRKLRKTPHQLREDAEARARALEEAIAESHPVDERTLTYIDALQSLRLQQEDHRRLREAAARCRQALHAKECNGPWHVGPCEEVRLALGGKPAAQVMREHAERNRKPQEPPAQSEPPARE